MDKGEIWVPVKDYEQFYEISNYGRIRSKDRIVKNGVGTFVKKGKLLNPVDNGVGYCKICLYNTTGKKRFYVHRLVAQAFIENPEGKPQINHKDNNPKNNKAENLEWCTSKENCEWTTIQGRNKRTLSWLQHLHESQESIYKPVKATNIKTGAVIKYKSVNSVALAGFHPSCVSNCCQGKQMIHKGYTWSYELKG